MFQCEILPSLCVIRIYCVLRCYRTSQPFAIPPPPMSKGPRLSAIDRVCITTVYVHRHLSSQSLSLHTTSICHSLPTRIPTPNEPPSQQTLPYVLGIINEGNWPPTPRPRPEGKQKLRARDSNLLIQRAGSMGETLLNTMGRSQSMGQCPLLLPPHPSLSPFRTNDQPTQEGKKQ